MTINRSYKQYIALSSALRRSKIKNYGSVASYFLEVFVEREGRILAVDVALKGLCKEGEFSKWRSEMISKGWLEWSSSQADRGQYFAGKKLVKYINRELQENKQIATVDQIYELDLRKAEKSEVDDLRIQMNEMKEWINQLSVASEPPDNELKKSKRKEATVQLSLLATGKSN